MTDGLFAIVAGLVGYDHGIGVGLATFVGLVLLRDIAQGNAGRRGGR